MKNILFRVLILTFLATPTQLSAQAETLQQIATELFHASGKISEQRPTVEIKSGLESPAQSFASSKKISIDQRALDLCQKAAEPQDAMATLLAPEIVSLYAPDESQVVQGAFYGFMAGYHTLGEEAIGFWEKLYESFPVLKEKMAFPKRKEWMSKAGRELDAFSPVFETANFFAIRGNYRFAEAYYEKIKQDIKVAIF